MTPEEILVAFTGLACAVAAAMVGWLLADKKVVEALVVTFAIAVCIWIVVSAL